MELRIMGNKEESLITMHCIYKKNAGNKIKFCMYYLEGPSDIVDGDVSLLAVVQGVELFHIVRYLSLS